MAKLGTIAAGVGTPTTIQITYLPQFLTFKTATVPQAMNIRALGDGTVVDMDGNGLTEVNNFLTVGQISGAFTYQLSNGLIRGKNVEITITNATAAAFDIYGYSTKLGDSYCIMQRQTILANSGVDFEDFAYLAVEAPGADDDFNITFEDGHFENGTIEDIESLLQYSQNNVGGIYLLDNTGQNIIKVNILPTAQRVAYLMQYQLVGDIENSPITRMQPVI